MKNDTARDKAIERLLAAKLRAAQGAGVARGEGCLDSETLAAYVERTLARPAKRDCETHLATCARCQEEVAELVRLGEADQPAIDRPAAARAPGAAWGVAWFRWAWAAPALAAVVVAGLFWYSREPRVLRQPSAQAPEEAAVKAPTPPSPVPSVPPAVAENKPVLPAPGRPGAPPELREAKEMANAASGTAPATRTALAKWVAAPANGRAVATADNLVRLESAAPPSAPARPAAGAPLTGTSSGAIATPSAAQGDARLVPLSGMAGGVIASAPSSEAEVAAVPLAPPAVAGSVQQEGAVTAETDSAAKAKKRELVDQKLARQKSTRSGGSSAFKAFHTYGRGNWRVGARGLIEKPGPGGSWVAVPSGVSADLNAIAFPTLSVGWVVGQAGTVSRSTDGGATWQKISFPTGEDLVRVSATSDQAARVTTSGGKIFVTSDGGQSWKNP